MTTRLEEGHTESILSVDCSKDSSGQIFTGGENGEVCHWHNDGTLIGKVGFGEDSDVASVYCLQNKPDFVYCSAGETIHLVDRRQLNGPVESHEINSDEINQITTNEKEEYLAACDDSGQIKILNLSTKKVHKTLRKHTNICAAVVFRPKRPWDLLSGGYDQRLLQWDFSRAKVVCDINISEVGVTPDQFDQYLVNPPFIHSMAVSVSGNLLACGTENALVQIFDSSKKMVTYMTALRGHTHGVSQVHFPKFDDYTLISGGNDGICNMWKLNTVAVNYHVNGYGNHNDANAAAASPPPNAQNDDAAQNIAANAQEDAINEESGEDSGPDPTALSPRPCFGIQHDEKINWITTGCSANRKFIVIADSSNEATVYNYPDQ